MANPSTLESFERLFLKKSGEFKDRSIIRSYLRHERVVTVPDANVIYPNSEEADIVYQENTQIPGILTIAADLGKPVDEQMFILKIKSVNVQTYSWDSQYVSGDDVLLPLTSTAGKIDRMGFMYDKKSNKWECTAIARGYPT